MTLAHSSTAEPRPWPAIGAQWASVVASVSPILSASQLATLARLGEERTAAVGEVL